MCAPLSLTATRCVAVDRVTNGSGTTRLPLAPVVANRFCPAGLIREKLWHGEGGMRMGGYGDSAYGGGAGYGGFEPEPSQQIMVRNVSVFSHILQVNGTAC